MKRYIKAAVRPASDEDPDIRKDIAKLAETSDVVNELSSDKDRKVREQIAKNPNTPLETLEKLSKDKSYKVRSAIARNPNTPSTTLAEMSERECMDSNGDHDWNGTYPITALFKNPNTPAEWRIKLLNSNRLSWNMLGSVARDKKSPAELLSAMAEFVFIQNYSGKLSDVLEYIGKNPNTPVDVLRKIYKNDSWAYEYLCKNPNTPSDVLKKIIKYPYLSDNYLAIVLKHPNLPEDIKSKYQAKVSEEKKKNSLQEYIGKDIWLSGELYGIMRDHYCYFRIVSIVDSRKNIYEVNVLYENTSWNEEPLEEFMQETENYRLDDSEDSNGEIYKPFETYTTEELLKELYPLDFDDED